MSTISQEESLLLQCLATTSLLGELSNANFLESDYYKQLSFSNKNIKNILTQFGLRNPATMQMMLYALVSTLIETETMSTYDNEDSCEKIDYFRHIRNAVAHSKCNYFSDRGKNFVIFSDSNNNGSKVCSIKMECYKVGIILMELQRLIMEYYNQNH